MIIRGQVESSIIAKKFSQDGKQDNLFHQKKLFLPQLSLNRSFPEQALWADGHQIHVLSFLRACVSFGFDILYLQRAPPPISSSTIKTLSVIAVAYYTTCDIPTCFGDGLSRKMKPG